MTVKEVNEWAVELVDIADGVQGLDTSQAKYLQDAFIMKLQKFVIVLGAKLD